LNETNGAGLNETSESGLFEGKFEGKFEGMRLIGLALLCPVSEALVTKGQLRKKFPVEFTGIQIWDPFCFPLPLPGFSCQGLREDKNSTMMNTNCSTAMSTRTVQ
jgi:hypothetical protein